MIDLLIRILLATAFVTLLSLIQCLINTGKDRRVRQGILPVVFTVLGIAAIFLATKHYNLVFVLTDSYDRLINSNILVLNAGIMMLLLILKLIICPIITMAWNDKKLIEATSFSFYKYDEYYNDWFLDEKWQDFRDYL